tara:strand:- start:946 stop:1536 length:591 start_codon:yes stop_codon:yes gene_type:complete
MYVKGGVEGFKYDYRGVDVNWIKVIMAFNEDAEVSETEIEATAEMAAHRRCAELTLESSAQTYFVDTTAAVERCATYWVPFTLTAARNAREDSERKYLKNKNDSIEVIFIDNTTDYDGSIATTRFGVEFFVLTQKQANELVSTFKTPAGRALNENWINEAKGELADLLTETWRNRLIKHEGKTIGRSRVAIKGFQN